MRSGRCLAVVGAALVLGAPGAAVQAQGSCFVNNQASCLFGNDASHAITLTITAAVRLATDLTNVALPAPTGAQFETGFGTETVLGLTVRSNWNWVISINAGAATWSAVGPLVRTDRPAADLQWATVSGGPFTDLATSLATVSSGGATGNTALSLYLRARYQWALDAPGDYSLVTQLTLTAP